MSTDVQLAHRCPHLVMEESVEIGDDRRSLVLRAPVASSRFVRILANSEYYIPSVGLHSQATLKASIAGPFRIVGCATGGNASSDTNVVTLTSSTETATIRLPLGLRISTDQIVRLL